jgi:hypothetical protein
MLCEHKTDNSSYAMLNGRFAVQNCGGVDIVGCCVDVQATKELLTPRDEQPPSYLLFRATRARPIT